MKELSKKELSNVAPASEMNASFELTSLQHTWKATKRLTTF